MSQSTPSRPQVAHPMGPDFGDGEEPPTAVKGKRKSSGSVQRENCQRQKTTRACDICKEKKTRCSGTCPCVRCQRLSLACEYKTTYSRGLGAPLPPSPELPFDDQHDEPTYFKRNPGFLTPIQQPLQAPLQHGMSHAATSGNIDLIAADFHNGYVGLASGASFINRVCRRLNHDKASSSGGGSVSDSDFSDCPSVTRFGDKPYSSFYKLDFSLPPMEATLELVATYFEYAIVTYRFLHRGLVEQWLRQIYESKFSASDRPTDVMVVQCSIVYSVLAIGTLYERGVPEPHADYDEQSERWFALSKQMLSWEAGAPQLETVQARMNQSLYLLASSRASECWFTFGNTVQFLTALNLHQKWPSSMVKEGKGTYMEQELRKRTFWSVYTLDKYLSVMFGRPRLLHDEDFDQELPDEVTDQDLFIDEPMMRSGVPDDSMIASVLHYRLARKLADISRKLYNLNPCRNSPFEEAILLKLELERWKETATPLLSCWSSQILQLGYSHAMIHITRLFLLNDCKDMPRASVMTYIQHCIGAAEEILTIINGLASRRALIHGFWFTHYVCFCAITVVYIHIIKQYQESSSTPSPSQEKVSNASQLQYLFSLAETCQQHLGKATSRSSPNRRYGIILEELRSEVHRQVVSSVQPGSQAEALDNSQKAGPKPDKSLAGSSFKSEPLKTVSSLEPNIMAPDVLPTDPPTSQFMEDSFTLYDNLMFPNISDTSAWWAQLDSWAYTNLPEEPSLFQF